MTSTIPMQRKLQVRPVPALLFLFFAGVTGYVLFEDALHGASVTTSHVTSVAVLVATIAAGHYIIPQIKAGAAISALGLLIVFAAGTFYVVTSSGARNAETAVNKKSAAADINAQRTHERYKLSEAEKMLAGAQSELARECKSGAGKRCKGIETTIAVYQAAITGHKATLAKLGPEQSADLYAHMGRVFAALPFVTATAEAIATSLALILPYVLVAVVEIATLTFGGMAITHVNRPVPLGTVTDAEMTYLRESFFNPPPEPPKPGRPMIPTNSGNVVRLKRHPVIEALSNNGGSVGSNKELAQLMGCEPGESSKRVSEIEHLLDCKMVGKEKRIALKSRAA